MTHIRLMTSADLDLAMRLKSQAGWNQTQADWRRFLAMQPDGCFVAELDGVAVGTAVGCVFGDVAWIAMVLVDLAARARGVGTALVQHAMSFVEGRHRDLGSCRGPQIGASGRHLLYRQRGARRAECGREFRQ